MNHSDSTNIIPSSLRFLKEQNRVWTNFAPENQHYEKVELHGKKDLEF